MQQSFVKKEHNIIDSALELISLKCRMNDILLALELKKLKKDIEILDQDVRVMILSGLDKLKNNK